MATIINKGVAALPGGGAGGHPAGSPPSSSGKDAGQGTGLFVGFYLAVCGIIFTLPMPYEDVRAIKLALTDIEWTLKGDSQAKVENAVQLFKVAGSASEDSMAANYNALKLELAERYTFECILYYRGCKDLCLAMDRYIQALRGQR